MINRLTGNLLCQVLDYLEIFYVPLISLLSKSCNKILKKENVEFYLYQKLFYKTLELQSPRNFYGNIRSNNLNLEDDPCTLFLRLQRHFSPSNLRSAKKILKNFDGKLSAINDHSFSFGVDRFPLITVNISELALLNSDSIDGILQKESIPSVPFTSIYLNKSGSISAKLSCIAYFEVQFTLIQASGINKPTDRLLFGLTTKPRSSNLQEIDVNDHLSFIYNHNGRILNCKKSIVNDWYYRFNPCDTVGCGIVYPPLSSNHGQLFFTRNGEVVLTEDLPNRSYLNHSWFPFVISPPSYEVKFNFGLERTWHFNINHFEEFKLASAQMPISYAQMVDLEIKRLESLSNGYNLISRLKCQAMNMLSSKQFGKPDSSYFHDLSQDQDMMLINNLVELEFLDNVNNGYSSDSDSIMSDKQQTFRSHSSLPSFAEDTMLPPQRTRQSPKSSMKKTSPSLFVGDTPKEKGRVSVVNFSNTVQFGLINPDMRADVEDDHDWCEDSMAVELSSVDSNAVNEMRECEISISTNALVPIFQKASNPVHIENTAGQNIPKEELKVSPPVLISSYMALADAQRASDWLQRATDGRFLGAILRTDAEYDSDRSIATSLFVEVASIDEDGSYTAYGAAYYEDEDLEVEMDFIRGKLAGGDDNMLLYNSEDSAGGACRKSTVKHKYLNNTDCLLDSPFSYHGKKQRTEKIGSEKSMEKATQAMTHYARLIEQEDGYDGDVGMDDVYSDSEVNPKHFTDPTKSGHVSSLIFSSSLTASGISHGTIFQRLPFIPRIASLTADTSSVDNVSGHNELLVLGMKGQQKLTARPRLQKRK